MLQIRASADVIFHLLYPLNWYACIQHSISPCVLSHVLMAQDTHWGFPKNPLTNIDVGPLLHDVWLRVARQQQASWASKPMFLGLKPIQHKKFLDYLSSVLLFFWGVFLHLFIAFNNVFCPSSCCFLFGCLLFVKHCHIPIDHRSISMIFHGIFNNKSGLLDCNFFPLQYMIQNHLFKSMKLSW